MTTNQSGIGRGYFTEVDFKKLTDWMQEIFEIENCALDKVYYSPYHPVHGIGTYRKDSEFRKPKPGMILLAAKEFNLDLSNSISVGDKLTDVQAGELAGVRQNFLYAPAQISNLSEFRIRKLRHCERRQSNLDENNWIATSPTVPRYDENCLNETSVNLFKSDGKITHHLSDIESYL